MKIYTAAGRMSYIDPYNQYVNKYARNSFSMEKITARPVSADLENLEAFLGSDVEVRGNKIIWASKNEESEANLDDVIIKSSHGFYTMPKSLFITEYTSFTHHTNMNRISND